MVRLSRDKTRLATGKAYALYIARMYIALAENWKADASRVCARLFRPVPPGFVSLATSTTRRMNTLHEYLQTPSIRTLDCFRVPEKNSRRDSSPY